ncbi:MAG: hypothetical protein K2J60_15480, partial [Acetatifactor sp.]|nr:hypothetical protein [Acetatifactor sp.]
RRKGDMYIVLKVVTPKKLNKEQKKIINIFGKKRNIHRRGDIYVSGSTTFGFNERVSLVGEIVKIVEGIIACVGGIVAIIVSILQFNSFNTGENVPSANIKESLQMFINNESIVEHAGIEYVQCNLVGDPCIAGYQVKVYPYISFELHDGITYIPICCLYTQEQYSAGNDGTCVLLRENTTEALRDFISEIFAESGKEVQTGCLVAIEYIHKDNQSEKEIFELRNGQLAWADDRIAIQVIKAVYDENSYKISMQSWPDSKDEIGCEILEKFGLGKETHYDEKK